MKKVIRLTENDIEKLVRKVINEGHYESNNYMFFNNLKTLKDAIDNMMAMDMSKVDQVLSDGHGWALDHIATSADDVLEVYNFLKAHCSHDNSEMM